MSYQLIIFDLDGTLYDLKAVHEANYTLQARFLQQQLGVSNSDAISILETNCIYPVISDHSKSATELFARLGLNMNEWRNYREANFDVTKIDKSTAVSNSTIKKFAELCPLVLLSSNSYKNIIKILDYLEIDNKLFRAIYCSDNNSLEESFNKKKAIQIIARGYAVQYCKVLSIGDRYQTDVLPMLELGGRGVVVTSPESLHLIVGDIKNNRLETKKQYAYYSE